MLKRPGSDGDSRVCTENDPARRSVLRGSRAVPRISTVANGRGSLVSQSRSQSPIPKTESFRVVRSRPMRGPRREKWLRPLWYLAGINVPVKAARPSSRLGPWRARRPIRRRPTDVPPTRRPSSARHADRLRHPDCRHDGGPACPCRTGRRAMDPRQRLGVAGRHSAHPTAEAHQSQPNTTGGGSGGSIRTYDQAASSRPLRRSSRARIRRSARLQSVTQSVTAPLSAPAPQPQGVPRTRRHARARDAPCRCERRREDDDTGCVTARAGTPRISAGAPGRLRGPTGAGARTHQPRCRPTAGPTGQQCIMRA